MKLERLGMASLEHSRHLTKNAVLILVVSTCASCPMFIAFSIGQPIRLTLCYGPLLWASSEKVCSAYSCLMLRQRSGVRPILRAPMSSLNTCIRSRLPTSWALRCLKDRMTCASTWTRITWWRRESSLSKTSWLFSRPTRVRELLIVRKLSTTTTRRLRASSFRSVTSWSRQRNHAASNWTTTCSAITQPTLSLCITQSASKASLLPTKIVILATWPYSARSTLNGTRLLLTSASPSESNIADFLNDMQFKLC